MTRAVCEHQEGGRLYGCDNRHFQEIAMPNSRILIVEDEAIVAGDLKAKLKFPYHL